MNRADTFIRADDTTGLGSPSDGGSAWVAITSILGISINRAYNYFGGTSLSVLEANSADVAVSCVPSGTTHAPGVCARVQDSSNYLFLRAGSTGIFLSKVVAGVTTQIGSDTGVVVHAGDTLEVHARGAGPTLVSAYVNGVVSTAIGSVSVSDASLQTSTRHGLYCQGSLAVFWSGFAITVFAPDQNIPVASSQTTSFRRRVFTY